MMEKIESRKLANWVLYRPNADPDDNEAVLARQLLRADEEIARLKAELKESDAHRVYCAKGWDQARERAEAAEKELDIQRAEISILKRGIADGEAKLAEAQYEAERQLRNALMADEKLAEKGEGRG